MQGGGSETRKDELPSFATLVVASSFQIRKMKISERQFGSPSGKRAVRGHVTLYDDVVVLWSPREPSREAGRVFSQDSGRFCGDGKDAQGSVALRRELSTVSGVITQTPVGSGSLLPPLWSQCDTGQPSAGSCKQTDRDVATCWRDRIKRQGCFSTGCISQGKMKRRSVPDLLGSEERVYGKVGLTVIDVKNRICVPARSPFLT